MSPDNIAIRVKHLSKQYRLGGPQEPYHTFRDAIVNSIRAPLMVFHRKPPVEGFWALKDVSFDVEPGEVVGIIGRNGAGKSTLLKILSRITSPTEGTVELHGRVGSLLEVGTGFHPELTGRENIYLSGSILGMKRREIDAKLDDIVKFSEIEKFLDTPVKRYSSGMYVRLAFAVAAHLEPEILLVDEVLAVGDAAFQKKCLGKMGEVAKEGRTVLFVSHNMAAIASLCPRTILIANGTKEYDGLSEDTINHYVSGEENQFFNSDISLKKRTGKVTLRAKIIKIEVKTLDGKPIEVMDSTEPFKVILTVESYSDIRVAAYLDIRDLRNMLILTFCSEHFQRKIFHLKKGINTITCVIKPTYLAPKKYWMGCGLSIGYSEWVDSVDDGYCFEVNELDPYHSGFDFNLINAIYHVDHSWTEE